MSIKHNANETNNAVNLSLLIAVSKITLKQITNIKNNKRKSINVGNRKQQKHLGVSN